ncbi:UNVERIFIED_CONTAM: putative LRR receptor-like serine/threonine-protein kinase [Sesamum radiatum]|uniref:non-specific serine/threonine protein kinase n=1 Tax=Sesamum radiatum TaxID=300843 RepID=A0AAW2KLF5_SESRA
MGKYAAVFIFLGVFYPTFFYLAATLNSSTDEFSLLSLKTQITSDPNNIISTNWSRGTSFCTWIGVTCGRRHHRVTGLDVFDMGLEGTIAKEIGNLSFLTYLDLSNNSFTGLIPDEIGNLIRLRTLLMDYNELTGQIPNSIGFLRKLERLSLTRNHVVGTIPWSIFNISSLQRIGLTGNKLSGTLPLDICQHLPELEYLLLSINELSGNIPTSISMCAKLKALSLSFNNFSGSIPIAIGNLTELQTLYLGRNILTGELPSAIFNISSLLFLAAGNNKISGSIPENICNQSPELQILDLFRNQIEGELPLGLIRCRALQELALSSNKLTGNIHTDFWNLTMLQVLALVDNLLAGTIPPSLSNLSSLTVLDLGTNNFHGKVPSEIGLLRSLMECYLSFNYMLKGEVPLSIFNISTLKILDLSFNELFGNIPSSVTKGIPNLEILNLAFNQFSGSIPASISNLTKLRHFQLSRNSFSGHIPITLGNLRGLQYLLLGSNRFTNDLSIPGQEFLTSLTNCKDLNTLSITINPIIGELPKSIGWSNLSASLKQFMAHSCLIKGTLPSEIGNLSSLILLDIGGNELRGLIPATFGGLRSLQKLYLNQNKLQGSISNNLCNLENLYFVNLMENRLSGQLPGCFGSIASLRQIYLARNAFTSNVPSTFWLNSDVQFLDLSENLFNGSLALQIGNMKNIIQLNLSRNQLSGGIPSSIDQLVNLVNLSLSHNKIQGPIPDSFDKLKSLQYLDLSCNNISGSIPMSLETLTFLEYFNVSFNELIGEIPDGGPFINFGPEFFKGNIGLCGASRFNVKACERNTTKSSSKARILRVILPAIFTTVVGTTIIILFLRARSRNSSVLSLSSFPLGFIHERISYYEILRATNNLNQENVIGSGSIGSVYKAVFSPTLIVAIKVFNLDVQGALKSFDVECRVMRSILVKIITSCSNLDFKALVMKYMPNGNLDKWLHSSDCFLNFEQRLGTMIDVACAVEYLHHGYSSPIVHCDLKPTNVLLDEDMVAHVSDFGIAKLLTEDQLIVQTRNLGTIGYVAPEFGSTGLVSTMVDVYSYGILLIETFTRKKPTDEMFSAELMMKSWVSESYPNSIMQIVDADLLDANTGETVRANFQSCLTSIMGLALECTTDLPEERPNMKDVALRLKKIKH